MFLTFCANCNPSFILFHNINESTLDLVGSASITKVNVIIKTVHYFCPLHKFAETNYEAESASLPWKDKISCFKFHPTAKSSFL